MEFMVWALAHSLIVASLYFWVGREVRRREVDGDDRIAQGAFASWWYALALSSVAGALTTALYLGHRLPIYVYQTLSHASLGLILLGLWGLLYYLVYLYTGSRRALVPLAAGYGLFYLFTVGLVNWVGAPEALTDNGWTVMASPEADLPVWVGLTFLVFLVGPQIGASWALFRLGRRLEDRSQRYRLFLVSLSIFVWFGASLVVAAVQTAQEGDDGGGETSLGWQIGSRVLALAAAATTLAAYRPPKWIQRRYGIEPLT
ncbi:MAG: hypothetical protein ACPGQL_09940 [Thermoplasmatota archaeon]